MKKFLRKNTTIGFMYDKILSRGQNYLQHSQLHKVHFYVTI